MSNKYKSFTLIEIILFIVVFSLGVMGVLTMFISGVGRMFDPTVRLRGVQVAQGVMEGVYGKYWDEDTITSDNGSIVLSSANIGKESESSINEFDDIDDFVDSCNTAKEYDSSDFELTSGYKVYITVTFANVSSGTISTTCTATNFKLTVVNVKMDNWGEEYTLKYLSGNY